MKKSIIVIAGGGTGGHIYPGVSVAREIEKQDANCSVHFVGTPRGIEKNIVPKEGFPLHLIPVGQLHKSIGPLKRIKTMVTLPLSFLKCFWLCLKLRPRAVLGVGGYASGPFVLVASLLGIPTSVWEPNAVPGMANRLLARFVKKIFVVFPVAGKNLPQKKVQPSGMPVRFESVEKSVNKKNFQVLVFGGSQGAQAINQAIREMVENHKELCQKIHLVHQTGKRDYESLKNFYEEEASDLLQDHLSVHDFLFDMKEQYAKADLVICRGGASTLAELMAAEQAAVIVPLPTAADNHQQKNAEAMLEKKAAQMILQKDLNGDRLAATIEELLKDPSRLEQMGQNARSMFRTGAARELAQILLNSI